MHVYILVYSYMYVYIRTYIYIYVFQKGKFHCWHFHTVTTVKVFMWSSPAGVTTYESYGATYLEQIFCRRGFLCFYYNQIQYFLLTGKFSFKSYHEKNIYSNKTYLRLQSVLLCLLDVVYSLYFLVQNQQEKKNHTVLLFTYRY